jgi:uroporphyrinogen decarboxylase
MKHRERVLQALQHRQPDRPPIDLSGHRSSGISAIAYARLRRYLGLPERPIRVYDPIQQLAVVDEDVLDLFDIDTIELGRAFALEQEHWSAWELPDGTPCFLPAWVRPARVGNRWVIRSDSGQIIAHMPAGALYFEQSFYPFADGPADHTKIAEVLDESMWTAIASPPGPIASGEEGAIKLAEGARRLRASTDRAILGLFGGNLLEIGQFLYRNDGFLMLLAGDPDAAHDFLERVTAMHLKNLERFLGAVGHSIDVIVFGDDLGMQNGPQISPAMYRNVFKPLHAKMWRRAKELAPVKVMLHCCGGVRELLPDLIDAGLDAINPVQVSCRGMEASALKRDFGDGIVFWGGGCDTQIELSQGTPDHIRTHVRKQIASLAPGGGFVFQQVHNILADVPPENIVAMYEAARG